MTGILLFRNLSYLRGHQVGRENCCRMAGFHGGDITKRKRQMSIVSKNKFRTIIYRGFTREMLSFRHCKSMGIVHTSHTAIPCQTGFLFHTSTFFAWLRRYSSAAQFQSPLVLAMNSANARNSGSVAPRMANSSRGTRGRESPV